MHAPVPHSGHNKQGHYLITEDEESVQEPDIVLESEKKGSQLVPIATLKKILLQVLFLFYTYKTRISVLLVVY